MHLHLKSPTIEDVAPLQSLGRFAGLTLAVLVLLKVPTYAQDAALVTPAATSMSRAATPASEDPAAVNQTVTPPTDKDALQVNWLYGSFVPKNVPLIPLTGKQRWKLYVRSTYTTPGIYIKTVGFTLSDQYQWASSMHLWTRRRGTYINGLHQSCAGESKDLLSSGDPGLARADWHRLSLGWSISNRNCIFPANRPSGLP